MCAQCNMRRAGPSFVQSANKLVSSSRIAISKEILACLTSANEKRKHKNCGIMSSQQSETAGIPIFIVDAFSSSAFGG